MVETRNQSKRGSLVAPTPAKVLFADGDPTPQPTPDPGATPRAQRRGRAQQEPKQGRGRPRRAPLPPEDGLEPPPQSPRRRSRLAQAAPRGRAAGAGGRMADGPVSPASPRAHGAAGAAAARGAAARSPRVLAVQSARDRPRDADAPWLPWPLRRIAPGLPPQRPLRVDSSTVFWVVLIGPLLVWWLAVGAGVLSYRGLPGGKRVTHVMLWFDKGILRPAGTAIPFAILAARVAINAAADWLDRRAAPPAHRRGGSAHAGAAALPTLAWGCLGVYSLVALARGLLYLSHFYAMKAGLLADHVVSDHLFLGGTILVSLQSEGACLLSDAIRHLERRVTGREAALTAALLAGLGLYLCTAVDMYFTARYFHYPLESVVTTAAVFLLFQAPVLRWLAHSRLPRAAPAAGAAAASAAAPPARGYAPVPAAAYV